MENNQELRDLFAGLAIGIARINELLNDAHRDNETNEGTDEESRADAPEVPAAADDDEDSFQGKDGNEEVNQDFADLFRSSVQVINGNPCATRFGYDNDANTYTAEGGRVHDMSRSPPGRCFNCGKKHWRKDCPVYRHH